MGRKAGTTDGAKGRDNGWSTRPGRRMGRKAGTTDGARGRDDGWGTKPYVIFGDKFGLGISRVKGRGYTGRTVRK